VPLAAVLWSGGIGFGGVVAFLFADLIVIPIVLAYRKYYGTTFALRITALMLVTIIIAALIVDGVFGVVGLVPTGPRPSRTDVFGSVGLNYKLVLNVIATAIFLALIWLSRGGSASSACEHHGGGEHDHDGDQEHDHHGGTEVGTGHVALRESRLPGV
jgi:hypothetical protein